MRKDSINGKDVDAMRRFLTLFLIAVCVMAVTGCGTKKKDQATPRESIAGTYVHTYSEELEGEEITFQDYLILNEDHTGYGIAQDIVKITWDEAAIHTSDRDIPYQYEEKTETIILSEDGFRREFVFSGEPVPDEIAEMITDMD